MSTVLVLIGYVSIGCVDVDGCFFFQAEDGIRDLVRSRGLGDVYKRQAFVWPKKTQQPLFAAFQNLGHGHAAINYQIEGVLSLIHI